MLVLAIILQLIQGKQLLMKATMIMMMQAINATRKVSIVMQKLDYINNDKSIVIRRKMSCCED